MNVSRFLKNAVVTGLLVFAVSAVVSFFYALLAHGSGLVDWEGSIRIALIFGIVFPLIREIDSRKKQ